MLCTSGTGSSPVLTSGGSGGTSASFSTLTVSGTSTFATSGGSVGIGTTAPGAKLDVLSTGGEGYIINELSGAAQWYWGTSWSGGYVPSGMYFAKGTAVGNIKLAIASSGYVGIGTPTPGTNLDVVGNIQSSVYYDRDNTNYYMDLAANTMPYSIVTAGSVGVGTTAPGYKLVVNSGANGTQAQFGVPGFIDTYGDQTSLSSRADLTSGGSWTARSTSAAGLDLNPTAGQMIFWTNTGLTSGNTFSPGNKMSINPNGGVSIGNGYIYNDAGAGNLIVQGNVGIGTTNPGTKLDISGVAGIGSVLTDVDASLLGTTGLIFPSSAQGWAVPDAGISVTNVGNYGANLLFSSRNSNGGPLHERMRIQSDTGNVGIGTTTPTTAGLVVSTNVSGAAIDVTNNRIINVGTPLNAADAATKSYVDSAITTGVSGGITGTTNYIAKFTSANTVGNSLIFDNGTNVGIGITNQGARLAVVWNDSTTNMFGSSEELQLRNTNSTNNVWSGIGFYGSGNIAAGIAAQYYNQTNSYGSLNLFTRGAGGWINGMTISNGNVGINTTSPGTNLDVAGNINVGSVLYDRANTNYYVNPSGNVMPYAANLGGGLNVAGGASISGTVTVGGSMYSIEHDNGTATGATTINWASGNTQTLVLGASPIALTFTNGQSGGHYTLALKQDATGSRLVTWPANVRWSSGVAPTLTTTANKTDYAEFVYDGLSSTFDGVGFNANF